MRRVRAAGAMLCLAAQILALRPAWGGERPRPPASLFLHAAADPAGSDSTRSGLAPASPADRDGPRLWETGAPRSSRWGIVGSSVGLIAGVGLALRIKSEADKRYDSYLTLADPVEARRRLDAAQRYDRAALIGWAMAQVSFVGLVYFLTREGDRPLTPVTGEPLIRPERDGVEVGVRVRP
jgi:hypothetical protein